MADLLSHPITGATTINDLLHRHPRTATVLSRFGIDTCCGGGLSLEQAAHTAGVSASLLLTELHPVLEAA
jgi:regulator of cell morphogenesis and NO signaling